MATGDDWTRYSVLHAIASEARQMVDGGYQISPGLHVALERLDWREWADSAGPSSVPGWQEAWERDKHRVGRAVHEAWAAEKQRQGFANHALSVCPKELKRGICSWPDAKHHPDMLDYDDLAPHIQAYDIETGIVGYRFGFESAEKDAASTAGREEVGGE